MSKLSFRARALDPCKPMPIFLAEELPDLPEYSAINRAVPQMPSGMEKEEESEHHLQRAICTGLIIPTPEVFTTEVEFYERNYPSNYKMPRQLIHMQPLGLEQDIPDYDMDNADELWLNSQTRRLDLTPLKFEQMMDKLEKSSGQTVVTLNEAKALLKQDDEVSTAVYDYWLNKRLKMQHPLILSVRTENRSGTAANNPYLAFRRRTEKMQTRKNRKNDETSYEKMLKLRRDLSRAVTLLEMVKKREKTKREQLHLSIEVFEKRYQLRDFNGSIMSELTSSVKSSRPAFAPIYSNQYSHHSSTLPSGLSMATQHQQQHHYGSSAYHASSLGGVAPASVSTAATKRDLDGGGAGGGGGGGSRKEKRQYKKRKHKLQRDKHYTTQNVSSPAAIESTISSEDEELSGTHLVGSEGEDEGLYAFRRNKFCEYHRPLTKGYGNWPWESKEDNGLADSKYRFTLTSIRHPRPRCVGFARRRVGRGGRIVLDRMATEGDDLWSKLDYTIFDSKANQKRKSQDIVAVATAPDASSFEDEGISRDSNYISSSLATAATAAAADTKSPTRIASLHRKNSVRIQQRIRYANSDFYGDAYSSLFGLCSDDDETNRIGYDGTRISHRSNSSSSSSHRENNSISDLLNNRIKQEVTDADLAVGSVSEYDWPAAARLAASGESSSTTSLDQRDSGIVVDLVRTQCINKISNRNISNSSNHTNYVSDNSRTTTATAAMLDKRANVNEKFNVIKDELTAVIKREFEMDTNNSDDENVNLASLSNLLNASRAAAGIDSIVGDLKTIKTEPPSEDNFKRSDLTHSNYVDLNTSTKHLRNSALNYQLEQQHKQQLNSAVSGDTKHSFLPGGDGNFISGDSKAVIYNEFLEEIQKNWLHFHPRTPPATPPPGDRKSSSDEEATYSCVNFSEQTPISVEMQRLGAAPPTSVFAPEVDSDNPLFVTSPFTFNDLIGDEQFLNAATDSSNSATDFNLSGDSLNELNLSLGEDENEKMLENILEECQIDELKALNQTTTFWDGILEDGGLLDVIDDKKTIIGDAAKVADLLVNGASTPDGKDGKKVALKRKGSLPKNRVGCSQFSIANASQEEKFFRKDDPNASQLLQQSMKCEPPEDLLEVRPIVAPVSVIPEPKLPATQVLITTPVDSSLTQVTTTNTPVVGITPMNRSNFLANLDAGKVYIKQEPIVSVPPTIVTSATVNQVPINQMNTSSQVITLSNVKLETDNSNILTNVVASSSVSGITTITTNSMASGGIPTLLMTPLQQPHQQQGSQTQAPQQHIIFRHISQASQANQIKAGMNAAVSGYADGSGAILIASASPTKRHTNGPTDKNAIHLLKQRYANRRLTPQALQAVKQQQQLQLQQQQQQQLRQDDELISVVQGQKTQQTQHLQTGNFIKMSPFPVVVSEISVQQQQPLSASAVAVASNHNYSLQPSAQPITIIGHQQQPGGNKIILNASSAGGTVTAGTNFTIATPIQDLQAKLQYGQIPTSNIKVNLVTSSGIQQGSLIMDAKNSELVKTTLQQHQTPQITVATHQQHQQQQSVQQQQQQQHHQQQRIKLEKTMNMFIDPDQKRVLCKLVNLSSLQPKNSAGQTVQVSSSTAAQILNKAHAVQRLGNSAIVANVRTLTVNNQMIGTSAANQLPVNPIMAVTSGATGSGNSSSTMSVLNAGNSGSDIGIVHKQSGGSAAAGGGGGNDPATVSTGINLNTTNR